MFKTFEEQKASTHRCNYLSQQKQGGSRMMYDKKEHRRIVGSTYVQYM